MLLRSEVMRLGRIVTRQLRHLKFTLSYPAHGIRSYSKEMIADHVNHVVPVHRVALQHPKRVAIRDTHGHHTYRDVLKKAISLAKIIKNSIGAEKTQERVCILCPNDVTYVASQWACWAAGHIVVPLSPLHPPSLLGYYIEDSQASLVIATKSHSKLLQAVKGTLPKELETFILEDNWYENSSEDEAMSLQDTMPLEFYLGANAMMLYTSGTTGKPKGVLLSHYNLDAQVRMLLPVWRWTMNDVIVHALPLHHTHGVVNALLCPLYIGASCIMLPKFDAAAVWSNFLGANMQPDEKPTIFMGVPTMYSKLLTYYENTYEDKPRMREFIKATCSTNIRVMISGSAALPEPVFYKWKEATGVEIVERYGMTEIGSVLSIPLDGERRAGYVGVPSPGVSIRLAEFKPSPLGTKAEYSILYETNDKDIRIGNKKIEKSISGDLLIKGPNVFTCYWNKPEATAKDFTTDGWFRTGDAAQFDNGYFKILGRLSADIIKSGGYKISSLEIETHLLSHPDIAECTVVGIPDITWGQKVAAALVLKNPNAKMDFQVLRAWCKEKMAPYMVPTEWRIFNELPRNALGKVNKVEFAKAAFNGNATPSKL